MGLGNQGLQVLMAGGLLSGGSIRMEVPWCDSNRILLSKEYVRFLLVGETSGGSFRTLRGDKTHGFITKTKTYKIQSLNTHPLFLSFLSHTL